MNKLYAHKLYLNKSILFKEIESVITFQNRKHQGHMGTLVNCAACKQKSYQFFMIYSRKWKQRGYFLTYLCGTNLILKLDKNIMKKENYRPLSLMNMVAKVLNKILENRTQQYKKEFYTITKWDLFQICKADPVFRKQLV